MRRLLIPLTVLALFAAARAESVITSSTPSAMIPVIKGMGFTPTLDKSGQNPALTFKYKGSTISLEFIGCVASECKSVYASHGFDLQDGWDLVSANKWNAENLTTVYLDKDNDPWLGSTYALAGGFTKTNFLTWLKNYLSDLDSFADTLPSK